MIGNFFKEIISISSQFFWIIKHLLKSEKIYIDILKFYKGYGIKFSALVVFIITFISAFGFFVNIEIFENKLNSNISKNSNYIDYLIDQFPEINYDGKEISISENDSKIKFIKNNANVPIIAFDVSNNIKATQKQNILLVLKKREIIFPKIDYIKSMPYTKFLGDKPKIITHKDIKEFTTNTIQTFKKNILISIPIIFLVTFIDYIFENLFIIFLLYASTNFLKIKLKIRDIVRVILFASAPSSIASSILIFSIPEILFIAYFIKLFCLFLLYRAIKNIYENRVS